MRVPGPPLRFSPGSFPNTPSALKTTRLRPVLQQLRRTSHNHLPFEYPDTPHSDTPTHPPCPYNPMEGFALKRRRRDWSRAWAEVRPWPDGGPGTYKKTD